MDSLRLNQHRHQLPDHKLIQQVDTRWNSVYYMLERYLEQHETIKTTLCLLDRNDLLTPTSGHFATMREVVEVLAPFEAVTKEISSENYTSASKIIPISKCLQRLLAQMTPRPLVDSLVVEMRARFLGLEENKLLAVASSLDPRFKKLAYSDRDAAEKAVRIVVSEASTEQANSSKQQVSTSQPSSHTHSQQQIFDEQVHMLLLPLNELVLQPTLRCNSSFGHQ